MDDRVFAAAPLNKTASQVTARGEHWIPDRGEPPGYQRWDTPPATLRLPPGQPDHRGRTFGRLTVVGLLKRKTSNRKARWLVRCSCGSYEARSTKAMFSQSNNNDMCLDCKHLERIKQQPGMSVEAWLWGEDDNDERSGEAA